tara:strand:- start:171 stop:3146 length:2976 start_codon:yes stop_codon:yes gene_type:complete
MPKQLLNMPSFEGGLNNLLDPRDISLPELSFAQNVMCDKNGIIRNVGIAVRRNIGVLDGITDIRAGYGLYVFESSFGIGSVGSVTAGAYAATCKFEHDSEVHTDEDVWYVMISGNDGMHAHTARSGWLSLNETLSSTENVTFDFVDTKAVYHIADEGLRICNADYDHDFSKTSKSRWFGFIQKKNYFAGADNTKDYYFNGWYFLDNDIKAPTHFKVTTDAFSAQADYSPSSTTGEGFNLHLNATAGGNHDFSLAQDSDGAVIYEFASSFIYDGIQESLLHEDAGAGGKFITLLTVSGNNPDVSAMNSLQMSVKVNSGYNPRVTGGRIYFRPYQTNEEWVLLVDIDFEKGCRASLNDVYPNTPWTVIAETGESTQIAFESATGMTNDLPTYPSAINSTFLNIESYYTLNEWSPSEPRISIGYDVPDNTSVGYPNEEAEGYKCSTIVSRRCFIANTSLYKHESSSTASGSLSRERDRIYYSAINKFDSFPRSTHFIDVVRGDAEEYTALVGYADRLLAFKTYTLFIINIAAQDPREWFLESQHKGMGISGNQQVTETEDGVIWANGNGAYVYTGGDVRTTTTEDISVGADISNLVKNKISPESWINDTGNIGIGYIRKRRQLMVFESLNDVSGAKCFVYDFDTGTWTTSHGISHIFSGIMGSLSNIIQSSFGEAVIGGHAEALPSEQLVDNFDYADTELVDGDTGYINEDGTMDGYSISIYAGAGENPRLSIDDNETLNVEGDDIDSEPQVATELLYTIPTNLVDNQTYTFKTEISLTSDTYFITLGIQRSDGGYPASSLGQLTMPETGTHVIETEYFNQVGSTSFKIMIYAFTSGNINQLYSINYLSLIGAEVTGSTTFYRLNNVNHVTGAIGSTRFNVPQGALSVKTKDFDFGNPSIKKKIYAIYITFRTPWAANTQTTPVSYAIDGNTEYVNLNGNTGSTGGKWSVSKFYPSTPIECQSIKFKITNPSAAGMIEINDMSIEYRPMHKNVA